MLELAAAELLGALGGPWEYPLQLVLTVCNGKLLVSSTESAAGPQNLHIFKVLMSFVS